MNRKLTIALLSAITALYGIPARAQYVQQGSKLVGTGYIGPQPVQGRSVALSSDGNLALVGAPFDNNSAGGVFVFSRSNHSWTQNDYLTGLASRSGRSGTSVALSADGNTALVGSPFDSDAVGSAWVYTRSSGVWSHQPVQLTPSDPSGRAQFGNWVALSADGNTALIGGNRDGGTTGSAWVFTLSNGVWSQQGSKLAPSDGSIIGFFGTSVALSSDGNTALIGGPQVDDSQSTIRGGGWVFTRSNGVWRQQGNKLFPSDSKFPVSNPGFGTSVALSADGNTALLGGQNDNDFGAIWAFTRSNGAWSQQGAKMVPSDGIGPRAGASVALSADGNTAATGGLYDNGSTGAIWIFNRSNGVWTQNGNKLVGSGATGPSAPYQGSSVALSADGNTVMEGGPGDGATAGIGAAWVFVANAITFPNPGNQPVGATFALNATASSGLAVTFTSLTPGVCSVSGTQATMITSGTCTIQADQSGGSGYLAANPVTQSVTTVVLVTSLLSVTQNGFGVNRSTGYWVATLTVKNIGAGTINGPIEIVFANLPANVTMVNKAGIYQGNPYIVAATGALAPGSSVSVQIKFSNPQNQFINAVPAGYSGALFQ